MHFHAPEKFSARATGRLSRRCVLGEDLGIKVKALPEVAIAWSQSGMPAMGDGSSGQRKDVVGVEIAAIVTKLGKFAAE